MLVNVSLKKSNQTKGIYLQIPSIEIPEVQKPTKENINASKHFAKIKYIKNFFLNLLKIPRQENHSRTYKINMKINKCSFKENKYKRSKHIFEVCNLQRETYRNK